MTKLPDSHYCLAIFRLLPLLSAAIVMLALFTPPVQAATSTTPALYVGEYVTSCKERDENALFDARSGDCFVCPGTAPNRSVFAVSGGKYDGKRACFKKASTKHKKAIKKRKATGALNNQCKRKGEYLWIGTGSCYACPKGYKKTGLISSEKACSKRTAKKYQPATLFEERGCPENSWRHGLTDSCFRCPEGSVRNLKIGKPDSIEACTYTNITGLSNKQRILNATPEASKYSANKRENMSLFLFDIVRENQEKRDDPNGYRRRKMSELLASEIEAGDGFEVVTLMGGANISAIGGYSHMRGFAMGLNKDGEKVCKEVFTNSATIGASAGAGGGEELGVWRVTMEDVAGETNGVQGGISLLLGYSNGIHWAPDGKWTKPSDYVGLTVMNGVTNSGTGTGAGSGVGLDVGVEFVHGWTKERCTVPCDTLDWDDIPLFDSNASCNE